MKDLKCALRDCRFNQAYGCMADEINVTQSAVCSSYVPSDGKKSDKLFEFGADAAKPNYSVDTCVKCDANCLFQKNTRCVAVGITVLGENDLADCATFIKK
jgi:hypothetical protein